MLIVQKFGGTSVCSIERINNVSKRVMRTVEQGHQVVVTVSAMAGETDRLVGLAADVGGQYDHRELDVLLATGEPKRTALTRLVGGDPTLPAHGLPGLEIFTDLAIDPDPAAIQETQPRR